MKRLLWVIPALMFLASQVKAGCPTGYATALTNTQFLGIAPTCTKKVVTLLPTPPPAAIWSRYVIPGGGGRGFNNCTANYTLDQGSGFCAPNTSGGGAPFFCPPGSSSANEQASCQYPQPSNTTAPSGARWMPTLIPMRGGYVNQTTWAEVPGVPVVPTTYALTVINGTGGGSYLPGTVVPIVANPPPPRENFSNWTGAAVANPNASSTTLTMPSSAATVTANYNSPIPPPPPPASCKIVSEKILFLDAQGNTVGSITITVPN